MESDGLQRDVAMRVEDQVFDEDLNGDVAQVVPGTMGTKTDRVVREMPERCEQFIKKYSNNTISDEALLRLSLTPFAEQIDQIEPNRLWVINISMMPFEEFCTMRFFCKSLAEFIELIMFGSLNEIRQVHSTMRVRLRACASLPSVIHDEFEGRHVTSTMGEGWSPEATILVDMYGSMVSRAQDYFRHLIKNKSIEPLMTREGGVSCNEAYCADDHRIVLVKMSQEACEVVRSAKSWQSSQEELEKITKNVKAMEGLNQCQIAHGVHKTKT